MPLVGYVGENGVGEPVLIHLYMYKTTKRGGIII